VYFVALGGVVIRIGRLIAKEEENDDILVDMPCESSGSGLAEPQQANFHKYVVYCKFEYSTANSVAKTGNIGITSMPTTYIPT
jgi:hypothetical protein